MNRYGGAIFGKKGNIFTSMVLPALRTPEYNLIDLIGYVKGIYYNLGELWEEVIACDFIRTAPKLDVPVFITQGRYDRNTPPEIAKAWFDALQTPQKEWIWFEKSAHSPCHEEKDLWNEVVRTRVFGK
jgi:pimeloyl-ACP methyl ester carboxylesterase